MRGSRWDAARTPLAARRCPRPARASDTACPLAHVAGDDRCARSSPLLHVAIDLHVATGLWRTNATVTACQTRIRNDVNV